MGGEGRERESEGASRLNSYYNKDKWGFIAKEQNEGFDRGESTKRVGFVVVVVAKLT